MRALIFIFCMLFSASAWALPIPTERIGNAYNDGWWYPATSTYVGPGNRGGTAFGFSLVEGYRVSTLNGFISALGDRGAFGRVQMALHQGSRFGHDNVGPLPSNNIIYETDWYSVPIGWPAEESVHRSEPNIDLEAGDYWLAFRGGVPMNVGTLKATGYSLEGQILADIHNPEPATLLLMGGGLLAMFRRKRAL